MTKDLILNLLHEGKNGLVRTFDAVPDDKIAWKPLEQGRAALDLFGETTQICGATARLVASRGEEKIDASVFAQMRTERADWTREDAKAQLETYFSQLVSAVESLSDEEMEQLVTLPMGGGMTLTLGTWSMMAYRTFISRFAQINYIQTLYGDFDSH